MSRASGRLRALAAYGIALALTAWAGGWVWQHWDKVRAALTLSLPHLAALVPLELAAGLLSGLLNQVMAAHLGVVLRPREWVPLGFAGSLAHYVLPLRADAAMRAAYLNRRYGLALTRYVSAMTVVYVMSILVHCLLGAAAMGWIALRRGIVSWPLLAALTAGAAACAAALAFSPRAAERHANARFWGPLVRVHMGWDLLRRAPGLLAKAAAIALASVLIYAVRLSVAFEAVGHSLDLAGCLVVASLVALSTFLSITPASLGIREAAVVFSSMVLGITSEVGLLAAAADRAVSVLVTACLGLPAMLVLSRGVARGPDAAGGPALGAPARPAPEAGDAHGPEPSGDRP